MVTMGAACVRVVVSGTASPASNRGKIDCLRAVMSPVHRDSWDPVVSRDGPCPEMTRLRTVKLIRS